MLFDVFDVATYATNVATGESVVATFESYVATYNHLSQYTFNLMITWECAIRKYILFYNYDSSVHSVETSCLATFQNCWPL